MLYEVEESQRQRGLFTVLKALRTATFCALPLGHSASIGIGGRTDGEKSLAEYGESACAATVVVRSYDGLEAEGIRLSSVLTNT